MANIFRKNMNYAPKMPRSSKDMSFDNNFTTKFGQITPVFCQFVNAGESVSIDSNFAIQFKPTVFPLQTPIRANLHFVKVRLRNLMDKGEWEDFQFGNRTDITLPYHAVRGDVLKRMFKTGGLMDYLGVPTTYYGNGRYQPTFSATGPYSFSNNVSFYRLLGSVSTADAFCQSVTSSTVPSSSFVPFNAGRGELFFEEFTSTDSFTTSSPMIRIGLPIRIDNLSPISSLGSYLSQSSPHYGIIISEKVNGLYVRWLSFMTPNGVINSGSDTIFALNAVNQFISSSKGEVYFAPFRFYDSGEQVSPATVVRYLVSGTLVQGIDWVDLPNADDMLSQLAPSAFFARAYEAAYNFLYRSNQNVDPFKINGQEVWNKYIPETRTGADHYEYELHFRNWDDDFLTTAYKSPQLGQAPLVGITNLSSRFGSTDAELSIQREDGSIANIGVKLDDDGKAVSLSNTDLEPESSSVRLEAVRAVTEGISINDFRDVNAFQIWLERSMRRGRRYVDQLKAHTGVNARFDELDMPEFLGGVSRMVQVSKVNDTTSEGLGDYAGQLSLFDGVRHTIRDYCDEPSIILGLMTIVPQAAYSQLMPKFYSRRVATDFFDPAFNKIGLQPITYREVCPIQALVEGVNIDNVFGYQIPWYEDQSTVDEVHGQMRQISMRDRLMNRTFGQTPELSADFLHIDPAQVNDVFPDRNPDDDPIVGQIHFTFYKKSQIYNVHVPGIM